MHHFVTATVCILLCFFFFVFIIICFFCSPCALFHSLSLSVAVCRSCLCYSMSLMFIIYLVFFVFGLSLLLLAPAVDCFITVATAGLLFDWYLLVSGSRSFFVFIPSFLLFFHSVRHVFIYQSRKILQSFQFEATNSRLERIDCWHVAASIFIYYCGMFYCCCVVVVASNCIVELWRNAKNRNVVIKTDVTSDKSISAPLTARPSATHCGSLALLSFVLTNSPFLLYQIS